MFLCLLNMYNALVDERNSYGDNQKDLTEQPIQDLM